MAGHGRDLAATGAIGDDALASADAAPGRFAAVARETDLTRLRTAATAAARDASNGRILRARAARHGLDVELLSGEQEALAAGQGVISAIPEADGIVGVLGGGSLELIRVWEGMVQDRVSFPLGVLRIAAHRAKGPGALERQLLKALKASGWLGRGEGLPLYLVGGTWRALVWFVLFFFGFLLFVFFLFVLFLCV